jgi:ABC-2 type transport system ATP-binding protein
MLRGEGLVKSYSGNRVVHGITIEVPPGAIVGLVGANGAGKTTTLKMLAGLVEPTQGTCTLDGEPTLRPQTRARIGYLPEESPLYDDLTAHAYLRFFGSLYAIERAESRRRADALLNGLGFGSEHAKKTIGTLSKGLRRKVAIARCLLHRPDAILLDEPTSGLDPFTARELAGFIRRLRQEGKAVLLSAHDLAQVEELCDTIMILHRGRVVAQGPLEQLRKSFGSQTYTVRATVAFPGSHPQGTIHEGAFDQLPEVEAALEGVRRADGVVLEVDSVPPRLDEILRRVAEE